MLRSLGRMLGKLRSTADEFRKHFDEAVREAGAEDLQREVNALRRNNPLTQIRDTLEDAARDPLTQSSAKKQAESGADSGNDLGDDDLEPPPPLPPRNAAASAPTPAAPEPVVSPQTETADAPQPAAAPSKDAAGNEIRLNGEHRQPAN